MNILLRCFGCLLLLASVSAFADDHSTPVASVRVTFDRNGATDVHATGMADPASGRAITADDPVRIASISKLVLAIGVMRLVEQGTLDLDADLSKTLGYPVRNPAFPDAPITLRLLLSHTSSLTDGAGYWQVPFDGQFKDLLDDPKAWDAGHAPGTYWRYANAGFPLIAGVMERATGERFDLLMQRLVLEPLGLQACYGWPSCSEATAARAVVLYADGKPQVDDNQGGKPACGITKARDGSCDLSQWRPGTSSNVFGPQGGLRISANDLAKVGRLLLGDGEVDGVRLLQPASVAAMVGPEWSFDGSNGLTLEEDDPIRTRGGFTCRYGLAVHTLATGLPGCGDDPFGDGVPRVGHSGNAYGQLAGLWLDRKAGTGVVYFATGNDRPGPGERSAFTAVEETLARGDGIPRPEATRGRLLPDSDFSLSWTNFLTSAVTGDGDDRARLGGKFDGYATIAGTDIGLWPGVSVNAHAEFGYGRTVDPQGTGTLFPVNTALAFPRFNDEGFDLALNVTQRFGNASLTVGKINMIDNAGNTPVVRSDGREGFQNIALAAPPTFTTPPSIFGALLRIPTAGPIVTLGIWDPHSAIRRALPDDLFGDGVNGMAMLTQPVNVRGRRGFQSLMLSWTTERGFDLNDLPYVFLPPGSDALFREARGGYIARYQFQQFIWQDPDDATRGVGVFGQLSYVDDNPLPGNWSMSLGVTGNPWIASRPADRFGIAYFRTSMSRLLRDGLAPIVNLGDEQGIEAFYGFAIGNSLVLSADAQVIAPADRAHGTAVFLGARARVTF